MARIAGGRRQGEMVRERSGMNEYIFHVGKAPGRTEPAARRRFLADNPGTEATGTSSYQVLNASQRRDIATVVDCLWRNEDQYYAERDGDGRKNHILKILKRLRSAMKSDGGGNYIDVRHVPQHLFRCNRDDGTRLSHSQCDNMAEDESSAEFKLPILHPFHGDCRLGAQIENGSALLQLRFDASSGGEQADDGCVENACHRTVGEGLRQAAYAKTA